MNTITTTPTDPKRRALGRGLESLLPRSPATPPPTAPEPTAAAPAVMPWTEGERDIPLDLIDPNPYQTRTRMDEAALEELAASIRAHGLLQPIVIRYISSPQPADPSAADPTAADPVPAGRYQLIAGQRRWAACQRAGMTAVRAIVRQVSNQQAMEMTIIENLQREDLNPIEQAHAFDRLSRDFGLTQDEISLRTGKDRASIANYLRLLRLPHPVQVELAAGNITMGHAKAIMMLVDEDLMLKMLERVLAEGLSVRVTEQKVHEWMVPVGPAPEPERRRVDPNVRNMERELEGYLGMRVRIQDRGGRGKITFEYNSLEDFDKIVEPLTYGKRRRDIP